MVRISMAAVATIIFVFWCLSFRSTSAPNLYQPTYTPSMPFYRLLFNTSSPPPRFSFNNMPLGIMPARMAFDRGGPVHPLLDIADGHPFGASVYTLQSLLRHEPLRDVMLYDAERDKTDDQRNPDQEVGQFPRQITSVGTYARTDWTLIKYDGKVYLRGWVDASAAKQAASIDMISVFNVQSALPDGTRLTPITLPLAPVTGKGFTGETRNTVFNGSPSRASGTRQIPRDVQQVACARPDAGWSCVGKVDAITYFLLCDLGFHDRYAHRIAGLYA